MYDITIIYSKFSKGKFPVSPFDDNTFVFKNFQTDSKDDLFRVAVHNYVLNRPLQLDDSIRTYRKIEYLEQFFKKTYNYIIIDADDIKTQEDREKVLEYFKPYNCIIGESRCADQVTNFNLKGFLFTESLNSDDLRWAIANIHNDLEKYCNIDEAVARRVSLNAPIEKYNILLNSDGRLYKHVRRENNLTSTSSKCKNVDISKIDATQLNADNIETLCLQIFAQMGFVAMSVDEKNIIRFKHPSEVKTPGGYFWFSTSPYIMHHFNASKTISIYDQVRTLQCAKDLLAKKINYDDVLLKFNPLTKVTQVNCKYLQINSEIENNIEEFLEEDGGLFSIRSPMGTGKSTIIAKIIEEASSKDLRVLIITNRISVAEDFSKKYKLKLYNKDNYNINDSLICQYDSLRKYNIKFFDLVIMDEFISLMLHARNAINANSLNISKFFAAFRKKLVIADAFLTGYESFLLNEKKTNLFLLNNSYRDPTLLYSYSDVNYFVQNMLNIAKSNQITVSVTSLTFAHSLKKLFEKNNLKVIILTAETPILEKELIYKKFESSKNDKWDVLIYSPTLTVGVSNLNTTYYHFHYDSAMTTDVISSIQMIKRTRKAREIHIYIKERLTFVKTDFDDLVDEYLYNVGKASETNYLFEMNDYGEPKLSDIGKKCIQIDRFRNILEYNHKSAFFYMMNYHFLNKPEIIEKRFDFNILNTYRQQVMSESKQSLNAKVEQYLELVDDYDSLKDLKLTGFADYDSQIFSSVEKPEITLDIRKEMLKICMVDKQFIHKCRYYQILKQYSSKIIDKDDIRLMISDIIMRKRERVEEIAVLNDIINCDLEYLQDSYSIAFVEKNKKIKRLLQNCGYVIYNNNVERIGERYFEICREIKKFCEFVRR